VAFRAAGSRHPAPVICPSIQRKTCNILETLSNLLYLAEMEADDPLKVKTYLSLSKERLQAMIQLTIRKEDVGKQQQPWFGGDSLRW
jgi:hypothetical protein